MKIIQKPNHPTGKPLPDQQAGDPPESMTPAQDATTEPRQWDYRLGELVQVSGPKADKPQVGDKGPGCCIRMGEIRMNCKTWMGEDGMWHIHPSLEKRLLEQRERDSTPSANPQAEVSNESEEGTVVGRDEVRASTEEWGNTGDRQGLRPINAGGQCGNGERPTIGGQAGQDGQGGSGAGVGSGDSDKGVRFSAKSGSISPSDRLRDMFVKGQTIATEHKAKTRAGMLRKTHPAWAEAFLDGFYSRPDAPPRPLVSIEESTPYLTPVKGLFAEVIPTDPKSIVEMETVSLALEDQCRAIVTKGGSLAVRCLKRQIKRAELYAYMALLNDVLLSVDSMPVDNDIRTQVEYVTIRNFLTLTKIESWIFEVMVPIITPEPKFMSFLEEKKRIADKWASKDEAGKPILTSDEDGPSQQNLKFTQAARSSHDAELAVLHSKYADAIARQEEQTAQANAFWLKPVDIDVYCIPYSWIADRVAGCPAIMFMTTDPPSLDWPSPTLVWDPIKERGGLLNLFVSK